MEILRTRIAMQQRIDALRSAGASVGCVPTMGFLHDGHASLVRRAAAEHDAVVTSIFVNPTQFGPNEDFRRYPRDFDRDCRLLAEAGCGYVFAPDVDDMYPTGFDTTVRTGAVAMPFEGTFRPGHFDGVATVVTKLLVAMRPHVAYFGAKDYQQTLVVRRLVADLGLDVDIAVLPTIREANGLAMSSRNTYLSDDERHRAAVLFRALAAGRSTAAVTTDRSVIERAMADVLATEPSASIDYAAAADADTLAQPERFDSGQAIVLLLAVRLGTTRLIDNLVTTIGA